jgi:uncharacterized membrane protein
MPPGTIVTQNERKILFTLIGVGVMGFIAGLLTDSARLWPSFLLNAFYFLTLALGAIVFVSIHHVSNAAWSAALRRVPEAMMTYIPLGAAAMLALYFGRHSIY